MDLTPYKKVKIDRVEHMIEVFRKLPKKMIDLNEYITIDQTEEELLEARAAECGTTACLAGHVVLALGPKRWKVRKGETNTVYDRNGNEMHICNEAARLLGIDRSNAPGIHLFCPAGCGIDRNMSERAEALQRLRKLLKFAKKAQNK